MKKISLNLFATAFLICGVATSYAQNHDFAGSYIMNSFYMDYTTEEMSMDDLPLVIDENNVIQNFANYNPFNTITGIVEGNELTLTCEDEYMILDIDWDTFHYLVLNGETFGDDFEYAPITISYDSESDEYTMSSWMLWDYDPFGGTLEKVGYCMMFGLYPGEIEEARDLSGKYLVTGKKTVYSDGEPMETEDSFVMTIQPDESQPGFYEFPAFAGYEVGLVPRGWLGVYGAVYGNDIEIQGTDIELNEAGDGIKLAGPFDEFDDNYTVTIFFQEPESGIVSDFSVWRMEGGEPVEMIAKWSYLTFGPYDDSSVMQTVDIVTEDAPVYFDLRGVKVQNPSNGIYIRRQGNKAEKVVIRN